MNKMNSDEAIERFGKKIRGLGVDDELKRMGAEEGDIVKILDFEFIFKDY